MERNEEVNEFGISKQLEAKIEMALENGPLDENDLAYFRNCAKKDGVSDVDLNFYINQLSKIIGKKQSESIADAQAQYIQKQRDAIGNECPKCHKQIPPMSLECPYCHTKVVNKKANSSVQDLANKIEKVYYQEFSGNESAQESKKNQRIIDLITTFPVPNTKEDILEFLALAAPNSKSKGGILGTIPKRLMTYGVILVVLIILMFIFFPGSGNDYGVVPSLVAMWGLIGFVCLTFFVDKSTLRWNKIAQAWRSKFEQVLMKGRSMQGDSDFQSQLDYFEKL